MSGVTMIRSERPNRLRGSRRLCQRGSSTARRAVVWLAPSLPTAPGASIGLEDITDASHRLEVAREFRIALDLAPQSGHLHVDRAHVAAELRLLGEPLAADGSARPSRERCQQRRLRGGQVHRLLAPPELRALHVESE